MLVSMLSENDVLRSGVDSDSDDDLVSTGMGSGGVTHATEPTSPQPQDDARTFILMNVRSIVANLGGNADVST